MTPYRYVFMGVIKHTHEWIQVESTQLHAYGSLLAHLIQMGLEVYQLIWMDEVAFSYIFLILRWRRALNPYRSSIWKKHWWEMLSKAAWKSRDNKHRACLVCSAWTIASQTVTTASNIVCSLTSQCWLLCTLWGVAKGPDGLLLCAPLPWYMR
jgi:hypothetical protein